VTPQQLVKLGPVLHALVLEACEYVGVEPGELEVSCSAVMPNGSVQSFTLSPPALELVKYFVVEEL